LSAERSPREIAVSELDILDEPVELAFELDTPAQRDRRRQQGVRRVAQGKQHGSPERLDILVPELVEVAIPAVEDAKTCFELLDAQGAGAGGFDWHVG